MIVMDRIRMIKSWRYARWGALMPVPPEVVRHHLGDLRLLGRAEGTIEARRLAVLRMARIIQAPLMEATAADVAAWRAGLRVLDNTAVHYACHARGFFAWAAAAGYRADNPAAGLLLPPLTRGLPRPIGDDELAAAVLTAVYPVRQFLVLAAWAGLRAKEIAFLRRDCVLDTRRPPVLLIASTATKGRRERIVPMGPFVLEELALVLPRSGFVFGRADGKPGPNRPSRVSQMCNAHLHDHGIAESLHQLRHWFGTSTYRAKKDLRLTQELMGHADPATTAGYAAYDQAGAIEVVGMLPVPRRLRAVAG